MTNLINWITITLITEVGVYMGKVLITEQEKSILEELLLVTNSIDKLYKKLYELKLSNNQYKSKYHKLTSYLQMALNLENKLYNKLDLNYEKILRLIEFLSLQKTPDEGIFYPNDALFEETYIRTDDRIISRLRSLVIENKTIFNKKFFPDMCVPIKFDNDIMIPTDEDVFEDVNLFEAFSTEINKNFLILAQRFLDETTNNELREEMLQSLFDFSFTDKKIEHFMIANDFIIRNQQIVDDLPDNSFFKEDHMNYYLSKEVFLIPLLYENMDVLLNVQNKKRITGQRNTLLLRKLYIESILYLFDLKQLEVIIQGYHNSFEENEKEKIMKKKSYQLFQRAFNNVKNYKKTSQL